MASTVRRRPRPKFSGTLSRLCPWLLKTRSWWATPPRTGTLPRQVGTLFYGVGPELQGGEHPWGPDLTGLNEWIAAGMTRRTAVFFLRSRKAWWSVKLWLRRLPRLKGLCAGVSRWLLCGRCRSRLATMTAKRRRRRQQRLRRPSSMPPRAKNQTADQPQPADRRSFLGATEGGDGQRPTPWWPL